MHKTFFKTLTTLNVIILTACATPPGKMTTTESGKPEAIIAADVTTIKAAIIADLVNDGYQVEKDTPYSLEIVRSTKGNEDIAAYFLVGNVYSSNHRVVNYTFISTASGTRVIASPSIRAQLPGGKINSADLHNRDDVFNMFQTQLLDIKQKTEQH